MNTKADLKAAREAIGAKKFGDAIKAAKRVLIWEPENYNALVFLGVGYTGEGNDEEAEAAYRRAIDVNPDNLLAWQGLASFFEKRGRVLDYMTTLEQMVPIVIKSGDGNRLAEYFLKLCDIYKTESQKKYFHTLKLFLPGSQYYHMIQSAKNIPQPLEIWRTIVDTTEKEQAQLVESRIQSRRFRVDAGPIDEIQANVEAEVYSQSTLGDMYKTMLDLVEDPAEKRSLRLKLLTISYKRLPGVSDKKELYASILALARELVDDGCDDSLPYEILLEATDAKGVEQYDDVLLQHLAEHFKDSGLTKFYMGYQAYKEGNIDNAFDLFGEGLDASPHSLFGYQCLTRVYVDAKDYETGLEYATKGCDLVRKKAKDTGEMLQNVLLSLQLCMAYCYRQLDTKYYPDAMGLYQTILSREPNEIDALEGAGVILRANGKYDEALSNFEKVYKSCPSRHMALAEIGWIHCIKGNYSDALSFITKAIESAEEGVAEYSYRLGRVYWAMGDEYYSEAFRHFMQAVKYDSQFASGFTFLGHYYRTIQHDKVRAKKCYQKAFILDPIDTDAAFHLSNYYVDDNQTAEAEALFQQVTELCPKTAWAWKRLGYATMNAHNYSEAITCFQRALRNDTSDVRCWEGLAEAYAHEGRYIAALRAFERATDLDPGSIHANYQKSLVKQKIGLLTEAVAGFEQTLQLAKGTDQENHLPALKGLADTYFERAKDEIQKGFFGRAADSCGMVIRTAYHGLQCDPSIVGLWKLIGDTCALFHHIPSCVHLCPYDTLQQVIVAAHSAGSPHERLNFGQDPVQELVNEFIQLDVTEEGFYLPPTAALDVILACGSYAYKQALVCCKSHKAIAAAFWHDIALMYYWMAENRRSGQEPGDLSDIAIQCIRVALKHEPTQYQHWNALGVIALRDSPKISQYAFIKAVEYNNRSAVAWTNYGFLCMAQQDYELANQAFETAHAIDPEWISAWVGQAYVSSLWGTDSNVLFQHAYEASFGTALEASYGYAESVFNHILSAQAGDQSDLLVTPTFALQKLTEQKLKNALSLNLLGLLLERLRQFERASEAFAGAILALEAQGEAGTISEEELKVRTAKVRANLGRTLCAHGDFQGAIACYQDALNGPDLGPARVYCQLGAGIAYFFEDQLEQSLHMFEEALAETEENEALNLDVKVLLSKVLWALGGQEQRTVAKEQLFASISSHPDYLPAIFSLCVMGILEDDETLTQAAILEMSKMPMDVAFDQDKEHSIPWLISRVHLLQGQSPKAIRALSKSVHATPWLAPLWAQLGSGVLMSHKDTDLAERMTKSTLTVATLAKSGRADDLAEAYEHAAQALLKSGKEKTAASDKQKEAKRQAQRAIMTAPWRWSAWQTMALCVE